MAIKNKTDKAEAKYTVLTRSSSCKWSHCLSHLLEFFGAACAACLGALAARDSRVSGMHQVEFLSHGINISKQQM